MLLKSAEKPRYDPRSYRRICLLPVFGKVLERMLVNRLVGLTEEGMNERQYGFRSGRSTVDALCKMREIVEGSGSKYVLGVFVDFKGAFDHLSWLCTLRKLESMNCAEIAVWKSYFQERRVCLRGIYGTIWKEVEIGCPQGSVSGPILRNVMMNDLLNALSESEIEIVAYANDLLLLYQADSRARV